jgi:hypothetical protein
MTGLPKWPSLSNGYSQHPDTRRPTAGASQTFSAHFGLRCSSPSSNSVETVPTAAAKSALIPFNFDKKGRPSDALR